MGRAEPTALRGPDPGYWVNRMHLLGWVLMLIASASATAADKVSAGDPKLRQGEYVFNLAGCRHCHSADDGEPLAGGRPMATPFGTFYTPNITPDPAYGIGAWSEADLARALRHGRSPDGNAYFPAFPFTAYTRINDADLRALFAYLMAQPPSPRANREHELAWFLRWRIAARVWQWLFFEPEALEVRADRGTSWNRGAYIAEALAHCQECHTPRNTLGALRPDRAYAGNPQGPEGELVPNITAHRQTGIGNWSDESLTEFFRFGELPDGEYTTGSMEPVIEGIGKLTDSDRAALVEYIGSLPPIEHRVKQ